MTAPQRPVLAVRLSQPFQDFTRWKGGAGVMLLLAAAIAMGLANSPWHLAVEAFWQTPISIGVGASALSLSLRSIISDGLMAIFFLLVGLEIKGELLVGELSTPQSAALPLAAALGGMIVPALTYLAFNRDSGAAVGWGIPTATDIAFALGVLSMLGPRVPAPLFVFLSALAIADDLGAVLIISLFYGHQPDASWLLLGAGVMLALLIANRSGVAWRSVYAVLGVLLWYCVLRSGVHSTVAGVLMALCIPARSRIEATRFEQTVERELQAFAAATGDEARPVVSNGDQQRALSAIEVACEDAQPPLAHFRHQLYVPVNFWIMPIFALANAGVSLSDAGTGTSFRFGAVGMGVLLGLVVGKPVGILLATFLATRLGATLPRGVSWPAISGVACLAGIGFTMSLFVSGLAFNGTPLLAQAKLGIVVASVVAGLTGAIALWLTTTPPITVTGNVSQAREHG